MQLNIPLFDVSNGSDAAADSSFFAKNGYLVVKGLFPSDLIERLVAWTRNRFWDDEGTILFQRLQDEWKTNEDVQRLATAPAVLELLESLYGRKPIPFQTLNFPVGTQQRTHSDTIHFHSFPQRFMCGVWVALEAVNESNGPLHYYPGSHKLPCLENHDVGISGAFASRHPKEVYGPKHYKLYEDAIAELVEVAGLRKETVELEAGDALIWAANLLHGGEPIQQKGATRLSQVTHYYFENCRFYTPLLSDLPSARIFFRDDVKDIRTGKRAGQLATEEGPVQTFEKVGKLIDRAGTYVSASFLKGDAKVPQKNGK